MGLTWGQSIIKLHQNSILTYLDYTLPRNEYTIVAGDAFDDFFVAGYYKASDMTEFIETHIYEPTKSLAVADVDNLSIF